jgi:hypothetical protein
LLPKLILKLLLILISLLIQLSCAGDKKEDINTSFHGADSNNKTEDLLFDMICNTPENPESLFFYGFSPLYSDTGIEDGVIMESAFESVMLFHDIDVNYFGIYLESGTPRPVISRKLFIETGVLNKENIKEKLKLRYNFRNRNISAALFEMGKNDLKSSVPEQLYHFPEIEISVREKNPSWINLLPQIKGYNFSIGVSGRYSQISESIRQADLNAIEEMLKQKSISVVSKSDKGNYGTNGTEYSQSAINGFYIIRRWWDKDMRNYYSLGVSPGN